MKASKKVDKKLTKLMNKLADYIGRSTVFLAAFIIILSWFIFSLFLEYDTWYDIMDVCIFLITFLFLFIIQSSQNADTKAIQDKLDAVLEALPSATKNVEGEEKDIKQDAKKPANIDNGIK